MSTFLNVDSVLAAIRESLETTDYKSYKLIRIRGIPQNPTFVLERFEDIIDNFVTRDSDVFISTYVKAGTTWTQQIIHQLLRKGLPGGKYGESVPWLEALASDMLDSREAPGWTLAKVNEAQSPRYFKSHATVKDLPRGSGKIKVIYVARNPKDSCVSLFHHAKNKPEFGYTGDFRTFCEIFLAGNAENGSWFDHVLDWYTECQAHPESHLFMKYEDIYDDPATAVASIASFLNINVTEEELAAVVKNCSIDEMRETASIGMNHLRKGGYGGWRHMFSVATNELFDAVYADKMKDSDLKFNFGPNLFGVNLIV